MKELSSMATSIGTNEIVLGQLRARVEWETTLDGGTATVAPKRIQLVLATPPEATGGSIVAPIVLGSIEPSETGQPS